MELTAVLKERSRMAQNTDMEVADRIDQAIARRGMSYSEVARQMGVTPAAAWNWSKGKTTISVSRISDLAEVLDMDPAYLAFGKASVTKGSEQPELRWKFTPENIDIPQHYYTKSPVAEISQKWRLPRNFVETKLGGDERYCFIVECTQDTEDFLSNGDMVFVDGRKTVPTTNGNGIYLIFSPFFPKLASIVVSQLGKDTTYYVKFLGAEFVEERSPQDITILGRMSGSIRPCRDDT